MKIIIDTNIIFSSLLSSNEKYLKLFLNNNFYAPNYLVYEIFKYKPKIIKYSNLTLREIDEFFAFVLKKIYLVNEETLSTQSLKKSYELCKDIDRNDISFVALTIELNGLLLTGDKKLFNGLKNKKFNKLITLEEIL
ncbi:MULTISPECIES: PIN domain-containing protein [unclassified Lebetimonas]|uniref:PIN domain-containing protein n=1 Tax=unclassified Lebetimonas TaxID=2648158 RepID=UPI0004644C4C|nr:MULTISPECIES: PIN domain-containing protein [unclassified Lebetimonas]